jgi:hypothetical protein
MVSSFLIVQHSGLLVSSFLIVLQPLVKDVCAVLWAAIGCRLLVLARDDGGPDGGDRGAVFSGLDRSSPSLWYVSAAQRQHATAQCGITGGWSPSSPRAPPLVVLAAVLSDSLRGGRRCMLHVRRPSTTTAPKTTGNLLLLDLPCRGRPYVPEI